MVELQVLVYSIIDHDTKKATPFGVALFIKIIENFYSSCTKTVLYSGCIKRCFPNNTSSVSTCSSSGTQQSTGQTAAH